MRWMLSMIIVLTTQAIVSADAIDEVNEWRKRSGLPLFIEDPAMTKFATMKARYRAERNLRDGHQGPRPPAGWHEGTGEAYATWGWLTCETESEFMYAGAGICVGRDGTRFMVLVCRDGSVLTGSLLEAAGAGLIIEVDGEGRTLSLDDVAKANLHFEF